jgi:hypothetical protein
MNMRIVSTAALLCAVWTPLESRADLIDISDVTITAFADFTAQGKPPRTAFDAKVVPPESSDTVEVLVLADGFPFPNIPTDQTKAFASSATSADNFYGVGVSGFFIQDADPSNVLVASGSFQQTFTNNSTSSIFPSTNFLIPAPTLQFFGIGQDVDFPIDPARDVTANANIRMLTRVTDVNGTTVETILLDYGLRAFREPVVAGLGGRLLPLVSRDAGGVVSFFEEPDGSFGFQLPTLDVDDFDLGEIGPGETMEWIIEYITAVSTGFRETGVFAAIGDPFNLAVGGGHFTLNVGAAPPPPPPPGVPEPTAFALLALGLAARTSIRTYRGRR